MGFGWTVDGVADKTSIPKTRKRKTINRRENNIGLRQIVRSLFDDDLPNLVPTSTTGMPGAKCCSSGTHWTVYTKLENRRETNKTCQSTNTV